MAGSAILGTNLVDRVVPMADSLREKLNAKFGVRQYRIYLVRRVWSGAHRGEGNVSFVSQTELVPAPAVDLSKLEHTHTPYGIDEHGSITISEVSLTYTEQDLSPSDLADNEEFFYLIVDALGQGIHERVCLPEHLSSDREKGIGWIVQLRYTHPASGAGLDDTER